MTISACRRIPKQKWLRHRRPKSTKTQKDFPSRESIKRSRSLNTFSLGKAFGNWMNDRCRISIKNWNDSRDISFYRYLSVFQARLLHRECWNCDGKAMGLRRNYRIHDTGNVKPYISFNSATYCSLYTTCSLYTICMSNLSVWQTYLCDNLILHVSFEPHVFAVMLQQMGRVHF